MDTKLYQDILSYLAYQARTIDELRRWLAKRHMAAEEIETIIKQLTTEELLDDDRYTVQFIELSMKNRPQGRRMLALRLRKKGITPDTIDRHLPDLYPDQKEPELCRRYTEQKFHRFLGKKLTQKEVLRIGRNLASKGFNVGVIWQTLKKLGITSVKDQDEENFNQI